MAPINGRTDKPPEPPYRVMIPLRPRWPSPIPGERDGDFCRVFSHLRFDRPVFSRDVLVDLAQQLRHARSASLYLPAPGDGPVIHIPDLRSEEVDWEVETGTVTDGGLLV